MVSQDSDVKHYLVGIEYYLETNEEAKGMYEQLEAVLKAEGVQIDGTFRLVPLFYISTENPEVVEKLRDLGYRVSEAKPNTLHI